MPSPLPLQVRDEVLGMILLATSFNVFIFALELVQIAKYFSVFHENQAPFHVMVLAMLFIDLVSTASIFGVAYVDLIRGWGDVSVLRQQTVFFPIVNSTNTVVVFIMHAFLIRRYMILSSNRMLTSLLGLPALLTFIGGSIVTYTIARPSIENNTNTFQSIAVSIWNVSSFVTDALIVVTLTYELRRVKTSFKATESLIRRVIRTTVLSGMLTAVLALGALITYYAKPHTAISLLFSFPMGRASTFTVLYNLNDRRRTRAAAAMSASVALESISESRGRTLHTVPGMSVQVNVVQVNSTEDEIKLNLESVNQRRGSKFA
ncbi:hypothetical protein BKA62DRAFT_807314 [Auriculariales sp. MPI-PUGE-AT-0066]|nr:hypothetical protein BKA62DRAFT_807314 [Auriculariales sp. MPI-PUGE-AT-0066]